MSTEQTDQITIPSEPAVETAIAPAPVAEAPAAEKPAPNAEGHEGFQGRRGRGRGGSRSAPPARQAG